MIKKNLTLAKYMQQKEQTRVIFVQLLLTVIRSMTV
jgi:hypothetical protein